MGGVPADCTRAKESMRARRAARRCARCAVLRAGFQAYLPGSLPLPLIIYCSSQLACKAALVHPAAAALPPFVPTRPTNSAGTGAWSSRHWLSSTSTRLA